MAKCRKENKYECCEMIMERAKSVMDIIRMKMKREAKRLGFSEKEYLLISIMWKEKQISLNDLSSRSGLPKSTVSRLIEKFVKNGIVSRKVPDNNRRSVKLSIENTFRKRKVLMRAVLDEMADSADPLSLKKVMEGLNEFEKILN